MNIGYAVKRLFKLDFGRAFRQLNKTAEKSGKSKLYIFFDMLGCAVKYGAGPNDYELFEFYDIPSNKRKTYITRGVNNSLVKRFNNKDYWKYFDDKHLFNEKFKDFCHRDWITTETLNKENLGELMKKHKSVIYKPIDGTCGKQIEKYVCADYSLDDLYNILKEKPSGIIEEVVAQCSEINAVYPLSINTVRLVTIYKDGKATPVFAAWRIGAGGAVVDNLNSGGMAAVIDVKTGEITLPAADKDGITYESHPFTGEKIVGFKIPRWDEVLSTVEKACAVIPQVAYVGWDVCIRENDILLIEGNAYPGHDIYQLPVHTKDHIGLMERVKEFL